MFDGQFYVRKNVFLKTTLFAFFFFIFSSSPITASVPSLDEIQIQDPFAGTLLGECVGRGVRIQSENIPPFPVPLPEAVRVPFEYQNSSLFENPLNYIGNTHVEGPEEVRDVVFIVPGIFDNVEGPYFFRSPYIDFLAALSFRAGNNVIQLPNPLGESYVAANAHHDLTDFMAAAQNYLTVMQFTLNQLKQQNVRVGDVKIVGVSLGAFLAAMMLSYDAQGSSPMLSQSVLISPPSNLHHSIELLDQRIQEVQHDVSGTILLQTLFPFLALCFFKDDSHLTQASLHNFQALALRRGFIKPLLKTLKEVKEDYPDELKGYDFSLSEFKEKGSEFSFQALFHSFSPKMASLIQGDAGYLSFYLEQAQAKTYILASENDFIVKENSWESWQNTAPSHVHLTRLAYGGHIGVRASSNFKKFFTKIIQAD